MTEEFAITYHKPESFGWVRVPQHDRGGFWCWELPDGRLYLYPARAQVPKRNKVKVERN